MRGILLIASVTAAVFAGTTANAQEISQLVFRDVPRDSMAYTAMDTLAKRGIVAGYPEGYFRGRRVLTRYEFAVALNRALIEMNEETPPGDAGPWPHFLVEPTALESFLLLASLSQEFSRDMAEIGWRPRNLRAAFNGLNGRLYRGAAWPLVFGRKYDVVSSR